MATIGTQDRLLSVQHPSHLFKLETPSRHWKATPSHADVGRSQLCLSLGLTCRVVTASVSSSYFSTMAPLILSSASPSSSSPSPSSSSSGNSSSSSSARRSWYSSVSESAPSSSSSSSSSVGGGMGVATCVQLPWFQRYF